MSGPPVTIRVGLAYDASGGEVTSCVFIDAPAPGSDFSPEPDSGGAWVSVLDAAGAAVFHQPLPDPALGDEVVDEEGRLGQADAAPRRRTIIVELPWPGAGASLAIHVRKQPERSTRGRPPGTAEVGRAALEPAAVRVTRAGPPLQRLARWGHANPSALTLLFLPDGFTSAEMPAFRAIVGKTADAIQNTQPFARLLPALTAAFIEMPSRDSGIGPRPRDTCFKGRFTIPRVIDIEQRRAEKVINARLRTSGVALIVANTLDYGGSGGAATVFSCEPHWATEIAIHELGHTLFLLADEYTAGGQASTLRPVEANVSAHFDRPRLKWAARVAAATPLPTRAADLPPGLPPSAFVGAFEGAKYQASGIYRPALDCKMRTPGVPFCTVCTAIIEDRLSRHLP